MPNLETTNGVNVVEASVLPVEASVILHFGEGDSYEIEIAFSGPIPCQCMDRLDVALRENMQRNCSCRGQGLRRRFVTPPSDKNPAELVLELVKMIREKLKDFVSRVIEGTKQEMGDLLGTSRQYA